MTLFIVNPNSGAKKDAADFISLIKKNFPRAQIALTERGGHAYELAREAAQKGFDKVIACGGDGTINETARGLMNTDTALGVIPRGSGNGFAREIEMPLDNEEALRVLQSAAPVRCDMGQLNRDFFLNVAGVGIEADIAHAFAVCGKRGKLPYFRLGLKMILSYKPRAVKIKSGGTETTVAPLTLVFANGSQYGSNFKIAPRASLTDGFLDMVQVLNKNIFKLILGLPAFFSSGFRPFDPTLTQKIKDVSLDCGGPVYYHIDGEPKEEKSGKFEIKIIPSCIKVLIPEE